MKYEALPFSWYCSRCSRSHDYGQVGILLLSGRDRVRRWHCYPCSIDALYEEVSL